MIFLALILIVSAFLFGERTIQSLMRDQLLQKDHMHGFLIFYFVSVLAPAKANSSAIFLILLITLVWNLIFIVARPLLYLHYSNKFRDNAEIFLEGIILRMLSGNSFRSACSAAVCGDAFTQQELRKLLALVFFKQQSSILISNFFFQWLRRELSTIDEQPHLALTRVRGLRRNLALESEFRRRSKQIRSRINIQSCVMIMIYLLLLAVFWRSPTFRLDSSSFFLSFSLFAVGGFWILIDGRRMKWKT